MPTAQITGVRYNGEGCYELETNHPVFVYFYAHKYCSLINLLFN